MRGLYVIFPWTIKSALLLQTSEPFDSCDEFKFFIKVGPFPGGFGRPLIVFCLLLGASFLGGFCNVACGFLAGTGFRQSIRETASLRFSNISEKFIERYRLQVF